MCEMYKALSKLVCDYLKTVFFLLLYVSNLEFLERLNYWTPNFLSLSFPNKFLCQLEGALECEPNSNSRYVWGSISQKDKHCYAFKLVNWERQCGDGDSHCASSY